MRTTITVIIAILLFVSPLWAADVTLKWDANTEPDLAGYRIFYRQHGENYDYVNPIWEGTEPTCTVDISADGYFVARAFDTSALESGDSNEVFYGGITPPDSPKNLIRQAIQAMIDGLHALDNAIAQMEF